MAGKNDEIKDGAGGTFRKRKKFLQKFFSLPAKKNIRFYSKLFREVTRI